jgi:hypothetical protein
MDKEELAERPLLAAWVYINQWEHLPTPTADEEYARLLTYSNDKERGVRLRKGSSTETFVVKVLSYIDSQIAELIAARKEGSGKIA